MVDTVLERLGMRLRPVALGTAACVWCAGTAAYAQPAGGNQRALHASFSLSALYDSNFARSSPTLAAVRGIDRQEYTLRPQVEVNVVQPLGRQSVFLRGSAGYAFHKNNTRLNRPRADLQGGYMTTLGPCQVSALASYKASLSDLGTVDVPGVKNLLESYSTGLGTACGFGRFFGAVNAQRVESQNSERTQRTADSTLESVSTTLGYGTPTLGRIGLSYSYASSELPNRIIPGRPVGDGFFSQTFGVNVQRPVGRRLSLSATAGRTTVKREFAPPGVDQKFSSTSYGAAANYKFGDRLVLDVQADRAVTPTQRAGKLYDIATGIQANVRYKLGSRYTVVVGQRYDQINSNVDTSTPVAVVTKSRTWGSFATINYRQSDRASLGLDVRYDDRTTNLPDFDYTSTSVGLTARIGF